MTWHPPSSEKFGTPASVLPPIFAERPPGTTVLVKPKQLAQVSSDLQIPYTNGNPAQEVINELNLASVQELDPMDDQNAVCAESLSQCTAINEDRLLAREIPGPYGRRVYRDRPGPDVIDLLNTPTVLNVSPRRPWPAASILTASNPDSLFHTAPPPSFNMPESEFGADGWVYHG
ncbi:MAG: hypothetical protein Q9211_000402 [Gyalolechia sp. 1 TL-2023]